MQLINSPDNQFRDGNPATGAQGTFLAAVWHNAVQAEIAAPILAAGMELDPTDNGQLLKALKLMMLTGATPPQFDNGTKLATSNFVQRALGNFQTTVGVTSSVVLTQAEVGSFVEVTSGVGITITLPSTTGLLGAGLAIYNATSNPVTLAGAGSQTINAGHAGAPSQIIPPGGALILATDGASWSMIAQGGAYLSALAPLASPTFSNAIALNGNGGATSGALVISDPSNTNGAGMQLLGNGATTPNKFIRAFNGQLQVVNSAYTNILLSLDDSGDLTFSGYGYSATPPQFDVTNKLATMGALQRALGNCQAVVGVTSAVTLTQSAVGSFVEFTGPGGYAVTLPSTTGIGGSQLVFYNNGTGSVTLTAAAGQNINNGLINASGTTILSGGSLVVATDGTSWSVISGSGSASFGASGYSRFQNGMILQWTSFNASAANTFQAIPLPIAFTSAIFQVIVSSSSLNTPCNGAANGSSLTSVLAAASNAGGGGFVFVIGK